MVMARATNPMNLVELIEHPFGKGVLTTTGAQYGAETTGAASVTYTPLPDVATVYRPANAQIVEVEFGLTAAVKCGSTDATLWKFQASDNNTDWADLIAAQTLAAASTYGDVTCAGRFAASTNFALTANPFYVRGAIASAGSTNTAAGKMKNSSYVITKCKMW
mgnify:CR=1 FL=1